jgi:hypothetical protein
MHMSARDEAVKHIHRNRRLANDEFAYRGIRRRTARGWIGENGRPQLFVVDILDDIDLAAADAREFAAVVGGDSNGPIRQLDVAVPEALGKARNSPIRHGPGGQTHHQMDAGADILHAAKNAVTRKPRQSAAGYRRHRSILLD